MINGRVNESKESDFMKMKKILVSMFLLFLVLCLKSNVSNAAETDALNRWDLTKEYTVEQNSIRYHAYLYGGFIGQKENARYHNSSKN